MRVHILRMGRKKTTCPAFLDGAIRTARLFPIDADDLDVFLFVEKLGDVLFQPWGPYEEFDQLIRGEGSHTDLDEFVSSRLIEVFYRWTPKIKRAIGRDYWELALATGIPPGRRALDSVIGRKWSGTKELRSVADIPRTPFPVFLAQTSVFIRSSRNTLEIFEQSGASGAGVIDKIVSNKTPLDRIRRCATCRHVFWAADFRALTCGKKCSDRLSNLRKKEKSHGHIQTKG